MDECLLEKFYQTWYHELIRWCSHMAGDRDLAEDLVQEAFLRAISHLPLLETLSEKQQRAWFYRTVKICIWTGNAMNVTKRSHSRCSSPVRTRRNMP